MFINLLTILIGTLCGKMPFVFGSIPRPDIIGRKKLAFLYNQRLILKL
jgi:hypothetical protein